MIAKPELVKKVKEHFNLNIYETKVWLALLSKGIVSAGETAEISGVPRSRTYDVLESLEKRGFAIVKIGKPVKYIAVEPNVVLDKMKSEVMHNANERTTLLSGLKETNEYKELEQLHNTGLAPIKSEEISGFMRGKTNVSARLKELLSSAQKEIGIYTTAADFEKKARVFNATLDEAQKRNIKIKVGLSGTAEEIKRIGSKYNLKVKPIEHKGRTYIVDKKEVLFLISPEHAEEEIAIWLKTPFFTESLDALYDYHLKKLVN